MCTFILRRVLPQAQKLVSTLPSGDVNMCLVNLVVSLLAGSAPGQAAVHVTGLPDGAAEEQVRMVLPVPMRAIPTAISIDAESREAILDCGTTAAADAVVMQLAGKRLRGNVLVAHRVVGQADIEHTLQELIEAHQNRLKYDNGTVSEVVRTANFHLASMYIVFARD
jgi:hypothetical protein